MKTQTANDLSRALFALAILLAACGNPGVVPERKLLGRWHRVREDFVGDPLSSLAAEYIELHPQGVLVSLLYDEGPQTYWTVATGAYSVSDRGKIDVSGRCWKGLVSHACSKEYRFQVIADSLTFFSPEDKARRVEYRRIGEAGPDLPPTLAPPLPSAIPPQ